jgi:hypothetical protein
VIQLNGVLERPAELAGYDPAERVVKLRISSGRAILTVKEPLSVFASPSGLRQLVWDRLPLEPAEEVGFAEFLLLLESARMAGYFAYLRPGLESYDPEKGWQPLSGGGTPPTAEFAEALQSLARTASGELRERQATLLEEHAHEQRCYADLLTATEPFRVADPTTTWHQSLSLFTKILRLYVETDLLQMVGPMIDSVGGCVVESSG